MGRLWASLLLVVMERGHLRITLLHDQGQDHIITTGFLMASGKFPNTGLPTFYPVPSIDYASEGVHRCFLVPYNNSHLGSNQ